MKSDMTTKDKIRLIDEWVGQYMSLKTIYDKSEQLMGVCIDAPLFNVMWKCFDSYTDALAIAIGDRGNWLAWYCFENEMGNKGMAAGFSKRMKPVKTTADLVKLIEADV